MVATGADKTRSYDGDYMADGNIAEDIVMQYLQKEPNVSSVIDCRNNKERQEQEIDYEVLLTNGKKIFVEVKSDSYLGKSRNILFEFARINHTVLDLAFCIVRGWSVRSTATHFFYYAPSVNSIYIIKPNRLREAMQKYTKEHRKNAKISYVATDDIKSTLNILIPIEYVKEIKIVKLTE